jgi:hypothetical protein
VSIQAAVWTRVIGPVNQKELCRPSDLIHWAASQIAGHHVYMSTCDGRLPTPMISVGGAVWPAIPAVSGSGI